MTTDACPKCGHEFVRRKSGYAQNPDDPIPGREIWMCSLYKAGRTLQEIGDMYGLSRERVRQIIKRHGLTGESGGQFVTSTPKLIQKESDRRKRRDEKCFSVYGCDAQTFETLNNGLRRSDNSSAAMKFANQRNSARNRGIDWRLTFFEWMNIWIASGKWDQRGQGKGKYCMARKMDTGPYSVENVYITTCDDNVRDYQAELKVRGVEGEDGYKRLPENDNLFKPRQRVQRILADAGITKGERNG